MRAAIPHLKKRSDFLRVAASRRKWSAPGLVLQVAEQPAGEGPGARIGYTASRKVGNAVIRNRARRRLRAAVDALALHTLDRHDYVVIARGTTAGRTWPALLEDLETAMRRLKAWRNGEVRP